MTSSDPVGNEALASAARSYALNGYIKLANIFSRAEIMAITDIYDRFHGSVGHVCDINDEPRVPPTGSLLEENPQLTELIFAKTELFNVVRAATGADVQFAGSDAVHVYNDSIGTHRDTFYKYDFPKVLIFLSDTPVKSKFSDPIEQRHGGAFMVMPGTHALNDFYTARSSRLCNWPYEQSINYSFTSPSFTLVTAGAESPTGLKLEQQRQNRNKYGAFAKITFQKGDVVLFSTRALHALYPLFDPPTKQENRSRKRHVKSKPHSIGPAPLKLLGLLFIEGYSQHNSQSLEEAINSSEHNKDLVEYISTVYNLRLYNTIVDHGELAKAAIARVSGRAMGLNRSIDSILDPETRSAVARHNMIHAYYEKHSRPIDEAAGRSKEEIHARFLTYLKRHDDIISEEDERINATLEILAKEQPCLGGIDQSIKPKWKGLARMLPFIQNERVYLFYKKLARQFGRL